MVVLGLAAAAVIRRRATDDVHSVEHYHRQLHTLEEISSHPTVAGSGGEKNGHDDAAFPASAFKVAGSTTVRLTDAGHTIVPPVPPPPVPNPSEPVHFDDSPVDASRPVILPGGDDRAMHSINHRPRRLGGPLAAVAAVMVLIVVLIVTGLHSNTPPKHPKSSGTATTVTTAPARSHPRTGTGATGHAKKTTPTTTPPAVSAPTATSQSGATYQVADASYSLALLGEDRGMLDLRDGHEQRHGAVHRRPHLGPVAHGQCERAGDRRRGRAGRLRGDGQRGAGRIALRVPSALHVEVRAAGHGNAAPADRPPRRAAGSVRSGLPAQAEGVEEEGQTRAPPPSRRRSGPRALRARPPARCAARPWWRAFRRGSWPPTWPAPSRRPEDR